MYFTRMQSIFRSCVQISLFTGNLTLEDMMMVLPFQNQLFQCGLNGQDLKQLLELSVIEYEPKEKYFHYFLFFSGKCNIEYATH